MYNIKKYDKVAPQGIKVFNPDKYNITDECKNPDGIIIRSSMILDLDFNPELKCIARIGAGYNNIPVDRCTKAGIAVFNCPGGNANAVKELTLAAIVMTMRNVEAAKKWLKELSSEDRAAGKAVEKGKEVFSGPELLGKQITIIGTGAIGGRMAQACDALGMKVMAYDPYLPHAREQELKQFCEFKPTLAEALEGSDIVTVHIPLNAANKGFINKDAIDKMVDGVYLINYARGPICDEDAVCDALESGKIKAYATDFPTERQLFMDNVFATPHLGAGSPEAEVNVSVMGAKQTIDYLENGNIVNSVNLPDVSFARAEGARVCIIHDNKVGMLGQITDRVTGMKLNIENLVNKGREDVAYTILDFNGEVSPELKTALEQIDGVIRVRVID